MDKKTEVNQRATNEKLSGCCAAAFFKTPCVLHIKLV